MRDRITNVSLTTATGHKVDMNATIFSVISTVVTNVLAVDLFGLIHVYVHTDRCQEFCHLNTGLLTSIEFLCGNIHVVEMNSVALDGEAVVVLALAQFLADALAILNVGIFDGLHRTDTICFELCFRTKSGYKT